LHCVCTVHALTQTLYHSDLTWDVSSELIY